MSVQVISYVESEKGLIEITLGIKKKRKQKKNRINANKNMKTSKTQGNNQMKNRRRKK